MTPGMRPHGTAGAALLEAVAALAIVASAVAGAAWMVLESVGNLARSHADESMYYEADQLLRAVSLWPRQELELHLGRTEQGNMTLHVIPAGDEVFDVHVSEATVGRPLLSTSVFRGRR